MPALSQTIHSDLRSHIRNLCMNARRDHRMFLHNDKVMSMILPADIKAQIEAVRDFLPVSRGTQHYSFKFPDFTITFAGMFDFPAIRPHGMALPDEDKNILQEFVDNWTRAGLDFGLVTAVIEALDRKCKTIQQMAFYFPGVVPLLDISGRKELAEKLRDSQAPRSFPAIPKELREACKRANTIMAMAMLAYSDKDHGVPANCSQVYSVEARTPEVDYDTSWTTSVPYLP